MAEKKRGFAEKLPEGEKLSHRMTILIKEKTYEDLRAIANQRGTTPNAIINTFLEKYVADNAELAEIYRKAKAAIEKIDSNAK